MTHGLPLLTFQTFIQLIASEFGSVLNTVLGGRQPVVAKIATILYSMTSERGGVQQKRSRDDVRFTS